MLSFAHTSQHKNYFGQVCGSGQDLRHSTRLALALQAQPLVCALPSGVIEAHRLMMRQQWTVSHSSGVSPGLLLHECQDRDSTHAKAGHLR